MLTQIEEATRVAVDTGALLAIASSRDQYHQRATETASRLRRAGGRCVGSLLVLGELHGHLIRRLKPSVAVRIVTALLEDAMFEWHDVSSDLVRAALRDWIESYHDQRFSLTDAVTFALMKRERLTHAFAFDNDFLVAGVQLL